MPSKMRRETYQYRFSVIKLGADGKAHANAVSFVHHGMATIQSFTRSRSLSSELSNQVQRELEEKNPGHTAVLQEIRRI